MKINSIIFMALCGLLTLNSCSKDDDESVSDILTGGTWKITQQRADYDGDGTLENDLEDCSKDDTHNFESGGTYKFDEGATKCDESDPQSSTGTWSLTSDEKTLTITDSGFSFPWTIKSISSNKIEVSTTFLGSAIEAVFERD